MLHTTQNRDYEQAETSYSIVIPAYNEEKRISRTLDQVLSFVAAQEWDAEVVVVNDGSEDQTSAIVRAYAKQHEHLRLIENPGNKGKGYSVRNGMMHARGDLLLFTDADLSSPIEESLKLFAAIQEGADIAIGSRWIYKRLQTKRQPIYRQILGRVFNRLLRHMLRLPFKDTQCGFKAFTRRAANTVFPQQVIERWGFDPEILFLARKAGLKTVEVPVHWGHSGGTRINPIIDGARMLADVMHIRWNSLTGKYTHEPAVV